MNTFLSKNFSFNEMTLTQHRELLAENRLAAQNEKIILNMRALCRTILEPIRADFNSPVVIHSGFRCEKLNSSIGGAQHSQHLLGEAADFHVVGFDTRGVYERILKLDISFGQCLLEGGDLKNPGWIHISLGYPWRAHGRCGEYMEIDTEGEGKGSSKHGVKLSGLFLP